MKSGPRGLAMLSYKRFFSLDPRGEESAEAFSPDFSWFKKKYIFLFTVWPWHRFMDHLHLKSLSEITLQLLQRGFHPACRAFFFAEILDTIKEPWGPQKKKSGTSNKLPSFMQVFTWCGVLEFRSPVLLLCNCSLGPVLCLDSQGFAVLWLHKCGIKPLWQLIALSQMARKFHRWDGRPLQRPGLTPDWVLHTGGNCWRRHDMTLSQHLSYDTIALQHALYHDMQSMLILFSPFNLFIGTTTTRIQHYTIKKTKLTEKLARVTPWLCT